LGDSFAVSAARKEAFMYSLFFKKVRPYKKLKKEAEQVASEVLASAPEQADVQLSIQRTQDPSHPYQVSLLVRGLRKPIIVTKSGDGLFHLLRQVEKLTLQELKRMKEKQIEAKRVPRTILPPQPVGRISLKA
jgi:hypothetical protein